MASQGCRRVEGTSWFVEGLPETLTKAQKAREAENRVFGISALAARPPKGSKLCKDFKTEKGCPHGNKCNAFSVLRK